MVLYQILSETEVLGKYTVIDKKKKKKEKKKGN